MKTMVNLLEFHESQLHVDAAIDLSPCDIIVSIVASLSKNPYTFTNLCWVHHSNIITHCRETDQSLSPTIKLNGP